MTSKPRRQNGEVPMSPETTDDKAQLYRFLASAMTTATLMLRNITFMKEVLDEALDLIDEAGKARITNVSSDIAHAVSLFQSTLLELALIDDDLDDEVCRDAE